MLILNIKLCVCLCAEMYAYVCVCVCIYKNMSRGGHWIGPALLLSVLFP